MAIRKRFLAAVVAALMSGDASANDFVIVDSNVARYPGGALMQARSLVSLRPREEITFIGPDGVVRRLTGRFEGVLEDGEAIAANQAARRAGLAGRNDAGVEAPAPTGRDAGIGLTGGGAGSAEVQIEGGSGSGGGGGIGRGKGAKGGKGRGAGKGGGRGKR